MQAKEETSCLPELSERPSPTFVAAADLTAKHPVPAGKFVKVAYVHKSVPRIIE